MSTLTIDFYLANSPLLSLKGLSFKKTIWMNCELDLIRVDECKSYAISVPNSHIDRDTCQVKKDELINFLFELQKKVPFDKIKVKGRYELSEEQLNDLIL